MMGYTEYCKDYIKDRLEEMEGMSSYGCDLAGEICQGILADGSATYSRQKAWDYLDEWRGEAGEFYDHYTREIGTPPNPFDDTEAFHVAMILEGCQAILSQCDIVDEIWNDKILLDGITIKEIISQVECASEIEF